MKTFFDDLNRLLMNPLRVSIICAVLGFVAIVYDGALFRYLSLKKDEQGAKERISKIQTATRALEHQIESTKDPAFIERQAREQLDLVNEDEIVFIFSNDQKD